MEKYASSIAPARQENQIRIGISSCLLGQQVRFDGGHKHDHFLTDTVGRFVTYVPVCPEMDIGLGIPRETIRLQRQGGEVRLVAPKTGKDHTAAMRTYARAKVRELEQADLCGYILKKDSPSCGMERVRVYEEGGMPDKSGRGLFAEALIAESPLLPVEEEGRLNDPRLRENFFERVFAYRRLKDLFAPRWGVGELVRFHTAEKLMLMAHDPKSYQALGQLVARAKEVPRTELGTTYSAAFMGALAKLATAKKHANVLQHLAGYFKKDLSAPEKQELLGVIEDFRAGLLPLIVPVTLIRHYVKLYRVSYLGGQTYLSPHPKELMLRNHV